MHPCTLPMHYPADEINMESVNIPEIPVIPLERTYAMGPDQLNSFRLQPPPLPPKFSIEHMPFSDMLKNRHVRYVYDDYLSLFKENVKLHQNYLELCRKHYQLKDYYESLHSPTTQPGNKTFLTSDFSMQDTNSAMESAPLLVEQPVVRPDQYPYDVLWNTEDISKCLEITFPNEGRPVRHCLRTEIGTIISQSRWEVIEQQAADIAREILLPLGDYISSRKFNREYFQFKWNKEWNEAITRLEAQQPILTLCSIHWKATLVLEHSINASWLKPNTLIARSTPSLLGRGSEVSKRKAQDNHSVSRKKKTRCPDIPTIIISPAASADAETSIDVSGIKVAPLYATLKGPVSSSSTSGIFSVQENSGSKLKITYSTTEGSESVE